jgi:cell division protein ZapA
MQNPEGLTRVEIYDQLYQIKGGIETDYVKQLAAYVDGKMRDIAQGSKTVDSLKVAVLAALNIVDELFQERERSRKLDSLVYDKSVECSRQLDQLLKR